MNVVKMHCYNQNPMFKLISFVKKYHKPAELEAKKRAVDRSGV